MELTNNQETIFVSVAAACGAAAAYLPTTAIPEPIKSIAVGILGTIAVALFAFWSRKVNMS